MRRFLLFSAEGVRVVLDNWRSTFDTELIVGSMNELVLVWIMLDSASSILVVDWQAMLHEMMGILGVTVVV